MPDGDLWQYIQKLIIHLGHTVARKIIDAGKVKAHTDRIPDAIEKGIITPYQQECNKVADVYAPPNHEHSPNQHLSNYASACHLRSKVYIDFVEVILKMIVRVVDSDRKARAEDVQLKVPTGLRKAVSDVVVSPRLPHDNEHEEPVEIQPVWSHPFLHHDTGSNIIQIYHFLRCIRLRPVVYPDSGASWIELFCLFELLGGQNYREPGEFLPGMLCTFAGDLRAFKQGMHKLLDHIPAPMCDFFKPHKAGPGTLGGTRLSSLGIVDFLPCISATIAYDDDGIRDDMLKCLLSCNTRLKAIQLDKLYDDVDPLQVKPTKINMHLKAPGWRGLGLARNIIQQAAESFDPDFSGRGSGHNVMPVALLLACPKCNHVKNAVRICLYSKGSYNQLGCCNPVCMQSAISKNWLCPCKVPWPKCLLHGPQGYTIANEARSRLDNKSSASSRNPASSSRVVPSVMPDDFDIQLVTYPCIVGKKAASAKQSFHANREAFMRCSSNNVELPKATGDRIDPRLSYSIPLTYDREHKPPEDSHTSDRSTFIATSSDVFIPAIAKYIATEDGSLTIHDNQARSTSSSSNIVQTRPAGSPVSLGLPSFPGRSAKARPRQQSRRLLREQSDEAARAFYDRSRNLSPITAQGGTVCNDISEGMPERPRGATPRHNMHSCNSDPSPNTEPDG